MGSSGGVASFNEQNQAGEVEQLCFGKTKEEVARACHQEAIRLWMHTMLGTVNARRGAYQSRVRVSVCV